MYDYIPDLTERFPEGFGGVDMTDRYYGCGSYSYGGYEPSYEELCEAGEYPISNMKFEIGNIYTNYEFDGGYTDYKICRISKSRDKVLCSERWYNVDGEGKRNPRWHKVIKDEYGNEKFQIHPNYDSWISAKGGE